MHNARGKRHSFAWPLNLIDGRNFEGIGFGTVMSGWIIAAVVIMMLSDVLS